MNESRKEIQLRVALYLRVSTEDQVEKYGLEAQRSAIEGIIKSRGKLKDGTDALVLVGKPFEYLDEGISGTKEIDERPAFRQLKEDILNAPDGQKPFDVVAVFKIDRFARKLRILIDVIKFFEEYGIEFISATESIDTSTPFGRAMLGIMGVIAELELETIRERTLRGREQAIQEGVFMGSHPPYGYMKDSKGHLIILEDEADIVKQIFQHFTIEKLTPQKIAGLLTEREVLSPDASAVKQGKRKGVSRKLNKPHFWRAERIREILSDDIYTGIIYYNKTRSGKVLPKPEWKQSTYRHDSIIYDHIFQLAQQRLQDLADRKILTDKKQENYLYLLRGLLRCEHCRKLISPEETDMMSWTGNKKLIDKQSRQYSYYYQCNRKNRAKFSVVCPVVPIPAKPLEDYVIDFIKQLLANPQAVYKYQSQLSSTKLNVQRLETDKKHLERWLNTLPQVRQNLRDQHTISAIDTPTLQKKLAELESKEVTYRDKLKQIDYQLSSAELSKGYKETFKQFAEKYGKSLDKAIKDRQQLYELVHMLIYQVIVYARPKQKSDVIGGRKKDNQMIPDRIDIYLNLPQNLLRELYTHKFGVRSDNL